MSIKGKVAIVTGSGSGIAKLQRFIWPKAERAWFSTMSIHRRLPKPWHSFRKPWPGRFRATWRWKARQNRWLKRPATVSVESIFWSTTLAYIIGDIEETSLEDWNRVISTNLTSHVPLFEVCDLPDVASAVKYDSLTWLR